MTEEFKYDVYPIPAYLSFIVYLFLILSCIFGNILVFVSFARDKGLWSVQNYYIFNLALTDIAMGVLVLPFHLIAYGILNYWPLGKGMCKLVLVVDFLVGTESVLTVILISYDRLRMVISGTGYPNIQTKKKVMTQIAVSWFLSFIIYGPAICVMTFFLV